MKKLVTKGVFAYIAAVFFIIGGSWLATCGIFKLITLCFGLEFTWAVATGVWLCLLLLSTAVSGTKKK